MRGLTFFVLALATVFGAAPADAGNQQYEPLAASVRAALSKAVADSKPQGTSFSSPLAATDWLSTMSARLTRRIPDRGYRLELLRAVHYEATRAGLEPELVLGLIQVESGFKKYAVSSAGARGYMQVMPFWVKLIGRQDDNLFHMRTNLRYGCIILRHYLDIEKGDLYRALGRYNGSLGRPAYPNAVHAVWKKHWHYAPPLLPTPTAVIASEAATASATISAAVPSAQAPARPAVPAQPGKIPSAGKRAGRESRFGK